MENKDTVVINLEKLAHEFRVMVSNFKFDDYALQAIAGGIEIMINKSLENPPKDEELNLNEDDSKLKEEVKKENDELKKDVKSKESKDEKSKV